MLTCQSAYRLPPVLPRPKIDPGGARLYTCHCLLRALSFTACPLRPLPQFAAGLYHGHGKRLHLDGSEYEGEWEANMRHGRGTQRFAGGEQHEGMWRNDRSVVWRLRSRGFNLGGGGGGSMETPKTVGGGSGKGFH